MSCERNSAKARVAGRANGVSKAAGKPDGNGLAPKGRFSWRGYASRLRGALRSGGDDRALALMRSELSAEIAGAFPVNALADERAGLLVDPPGWLSVGERVERLDVIDGALALMRKRGDIDDGQYLAALIDVPRQASRRPKRSSAPVSLLPERPVGAETDSASRVDPNRRITTRYRLLDLGEPITSNLPGGAINPDYDQTLQPRRRDRAASVAQIEAIAGKLEPSSLLSGNAGWDDGPPVINQDGMVESGNGRMLALRRAGEINPEGYAAYKDALLKRATSFGFDRAGVAGMARPVLVRERLTPLSRDEQQRFIIEANSASATRMGAAEQARADANLLPPGFFAGAGDVAGRFIGMLPQSEQAALVDERGLISAEGEARIERAMFVRALPGSSGERLSRLIYEESEAIDRVGAGIRKALPGLAALEDGIRAETINPTLGLGNDLAMAVEKLRDLRKQKMSVNDYLRQGKLQAELTPMQEQLLAQLDARRRSGRKVAELIDTYTGLALKTPALTQMQLPGIPPRQATAEGVLQAAMAVTADGVWVTPGQWTRAQKAISGFDDFPATEIEKLDKGQQALGALVANNASVAKAKSKRRGGYNWQQKWRVPAGGKSKKNWTVAVDDKGRWGCSCPAWIYQRKPADAGDDWWREPCQHIKRIANGE